MTALVCALLAAVATVAAADTAVDYARDVQPIFQKRCYGCHGPSQQMAGLRLDRREAAMRVVKPGDSAGSKLHMMISGSGKLRMPPSGAPLPASEIALLTRWIDSGAVWPTGDGPSRVPWSFAPLQRPLLPVARNDAANQNAIDVFIQTALDEKGIRPSPEADQRTLVRRLYLDLIGLPPTPEQTEAFLADKAPNAYEQLVDQLLASPHFGEKWARHWLDLARYADSEGGVHDFPRRFAWRYRDWVINAFNADMPFDRFTTEQMAGDLLPKATVSQKIATGFQRNTITSREGGVELERIRFEQLLDRTSTVGTVWLGLTVGCAQCHDHKYDPLTQKDFYRLMAFFENGDESDIEVPLPGELGIYRQYADEFRLQRDQLLKEYEIADTLTCLLYTSPSPRDS